MSDKPPPEKPYAGLLGLDTLPNSLKTLNTLATIVIGAALFSNSWPFTLDRGPAYSWWPFSWTLIFIYAWPTTAILLWLRLTGLRWRQGLVAVGIGLALYVIWQAMLAYIGWFLS